MTEELKYILSIEVPIEHKGDFLQRLSYLSKDPWRLRNVNPRSNTRNRKNLYIHYSGTEEIPSCTVCMNQEWQGVSYWRVIDIIHDIGQPNLTPCQHNALIEKFHIDIANESVKVYDGTAKIHTE